MITLPPDPTAYSRALARLWNEIAAVGRNPATGGYRRFAWSDADLELRDWFAGAAAGPRPRRDVRPGAATSGPGGATPTERPSRARRPGPRQPPRLGPGRWTVRRAARRRLGPGCPRGVAGRGFRAGAGRSRS